MFHGSVNHFVIAVLFRKMLHKYIANEWHITDLQGRTSVTIVEAKKTAVTENDHTVQPLMRVPCFP